MGVEINEKQHPRSFLENFCCHLEIDTRMLAMLGALLAIWFTLDFLTDGIFFTARNLYNLAVQTSVVGIMGNAGQAKQKIIQKMPENLSKNNLVAYL